MVSSSAERQLPCSLGDSVIPRSSWKDAAISDTRPGNVLCCNVWLTTAKKKKWLLTSPVWESWGRGCVWNPRGFHRWDVEQRSQRNFLWAALLLDRVGQDPGPLCGIFTRHRTRLLKRAVDAVLPKHPRGAHVVWGEHRAGGWSYVQKGAQKGSGKVSRELLSGLEMLFLCWAGVAASKMKIQQELAAEKRWEWRHQRKTWNLLVGTKERGICPN